MANKEKNYKHKTIVFNLDDADQYILYEHSMKRSNFSSYVKRLIQRDVDGYMFIKAQNNEEARSIKAPSNNKPLPKAGGFI